MYSSLSGFGHDKQSSPLLPICCSIYERQLNSRNTNVRRTHQPPRERLCSNQVWVGRTRAVFSAEREVEEKT